LRLTKTTTTKNNRNSFERKQYMTPKKTIQVRDLKPMKDAKGGAVLNHSSANVMASHSTASHGAASHSSLNKKHAQHGSTHGIN
jgi:hypothetical protein